MVVGQVGCGKTSLLFSVMQETILSKGNVSVAGSMAYVEQEPFIFSQTVKENILFGQQYDKERMDRAIAAAQLTRDVEIFSNGLDTVIGERGVNVSGGQKARISLARAIYSDADIVLLDDPLSAVDPEVANKIFDECKNGALKDKLVILNTHQLQFIEECESILLLKEGKVVKMGTYQEITETGFNIKDILDTYNQAMQEKEGDQGKKFEKEEEGPVEQAEEKEEEVDEETKAKRRKESDLIVAEDKGRDVTFKDFADYLSFTNVCAATTVTLGISLAIAVIQLLPNYIVSVWTKQDYETQQASPLML